MYMDMAFGVRSIDGKISMDIKVTRDVKRRLWGSLRNLQTNLCVELHFVMEKHKHSNKWDAPERRSLEKRVYGATSVARVWRDIHSVSLRIETRIWVLDLNAPQRMLSLAGANSGSVAPKRAGNEGAKQLYCMRYWMRNLQTNVRFFMVKHETCQQVKRSRAVNRKTRVWSHFRRAGVAGHSLRVATHRNAYMGARLKCATTNAVAGWSEFWIGCTKTRG